MLHKTEAFPVVILRLFLAYGPNQNEQRFLPQIIISCLNEKRFPTSSGEQLRDFCYVEDVVRAIYLVFENDFVNGEILNIASGKPVSIRKIIQTVRDIIGKGEPCFGDVLIVQVKICLYMQILRRLKDCWDGIHHIVWRVA